MGQDELPLKVVALGLETQNVALDADRLRALAGRSKGRCRELRNLPDVVDEIIARSVGLASAPRQATVVRLYDFTLGFLLFVALLAAEWMARRHWQLQ